MAERIWLRGEEGELKTLHEQPFATEDDLQTLIAQHPELLDGEQMRPVDPLRWILVTREQGVAEASDSGYRWALDHMIIDQDATPTLVEVKRGSNSEIRRTIVGQMLDYAAHGSQTWTAEELRRNFEESVRAANFDPHEKLKYLLQVDEEPDGESSWEDDFWERVATNLAARRLRLLFVADKIPDELARVVEFLNEQMPKIEVLAVEVKQFRGESTQTLVPRVIGRLAAAPGRGSAGSKNLTRETFLAGFPKEDQRDAACKLLDAAKKPGVHFNWGPSRVSIRGYSPNRHRASVAWLYLPSQSGNHGECFTFGVEPGVYDKPGDEDRGALLNAWADQFQDCGFAKPAQRDYLNAYIVEYDAAVQNIDWLVERLTTVLAQLKAL